MRKKIPYSRDPRDLFTPGLATDFFDPEYGPVPSEEALCAEMSRIAYLRHEDPGGRARLESLLRDRAKFDLTTCFDAAGTQGLVASGQNPQGNRVTVVAIRGTEPQDRGDLRYDARFWPATWAPGGAVHTGFSEASAAIREPLLGAIGNAQGRLLLTGHSLGAAVATLTASMLPAERRANTLLCTFGSPRVGDEAFAGSLAGVTHTRYAGACDVVTWVPPIVPFVRYQHHGVLRCLDREGRAHEFQSGESAHDEAAPLRSGCAGESPSEFFFALIARALPLRHLTDHAPINYMSAVWGIRA